MHLPGITLSLGAAPGEAAERRGCGRREHHARVLEGDVCLPGITPSLGAALGETAGPACSGPR